MNSLTIIACLVACALAGPVVVDNALNNGYKLAFDFTGPGNYSTFSCMYNSGYSAVFIRGYTSDKGGSFDPYAALSIRNAFNIGLGSEVYLVPSMSSTKGGISQFNELYNGLVKAGITVRYIWVQVTNPITWHNDAKRNIQIIDSIKSAAKAKGVLIGIYTSLYDWAQITNNYVGYSNVGDSLWYWKINGAGNRGETSPDFSDYYPFGGWYSPVVKQFAQSEIVCNQNINRNVYPSNGTLVAANAMKSEGPVVGGIMFK